MKARCLKIIGFLILALLLAGAVSAETASDNITQTDASIDSADSQVGDVNPESNVKELVEYENYKIYIPQDYSAEEMCVIGIEKMPLDAKGNISISVDDVERYNQKVSVGGNGIFAHDLNLDYGIHNVSISYSGDENYAGFIRTGSVENPFLHFSIYQYSDIYGGIEGFVSLDRGITGNIKVLLDDVVVLNERYREFCPIDLYYDGLYRTYEIQYFNGSQPDIIRKGSLLHESELDDPEIIIPSMLLVNKTYNLTFKSYNGSNGNLVLSGLVNGTFKVNDGIAVVPISAQDEGEYILNITYGNDTWTRYIEVSGLNILIYSLDTIYPWSWADSDGDSGPGIDIYVYSDFEDYKPTGNTTIYLNDKVIDTFQGPFDYLLVDGILWYYYTEPGNYSVTVAYSGDENFKPVNKTYTFSMSHYYCSCNDGIVNVGLLSDVSGVLTVNVNGKTVSTKKIKATYASYISLCEESYEISLSGLEKDTINIVEVDFKDDAGKSSFHESFNYVLTCPIDVGFIGDHEVYGKDNTFAFSMPWDVKNNPSVTIDGKSYNYTKITGYSEKWSWVFDDEDVSIFEVKINDLKPGNHSIVISYPGDSKYPSASFNETVNIQAEVGYMSDYLTEGAAYLILPDDAVGNLTVEIQYYGKSDYDVFKSVALKDGRATVQLPLGVYSFNAYYTGEDYDVNNMSYSVSIRPAAEYPDAMTYGENMQFKLDDYLNATLVFYIGYAEGYRLPVAEFDLNANKEISINKNLIDGAFKSGMAEALIKNNYEVYVANFLELIPVIYSGVGTFDEFYPIVVNFNDKLTGLKDISMQYGNSKTISLKVYDMYGKLVGKNQVVKIKIGKKTFTAKTNKNGAVSFKIPNTITPGKYTVTVTYKNAKVSKKLTVKQILTVKTVKVKKSAKKLVLTATLKKVNGKYLKGKKITFKFNGKTYKAKTNKKGVAKVTVKKSALKKLKVGKKVKYQATYLKDTVKRSAKVKK